MKKYMTYRPSIGDLNILPTYKVVKVRKENGAGISSPNTKVLNTGINAGEYVRNYEQNIPKERDGMLSAHDLTLYLVKFKD